MTYAPRLFSLITLTCLASACAAPTPTPVPEILPTPAAAVRLDEVQQAVFDIQHADELAFAQGYVWVKTSDGRVVQIDPADNAIVGEVKADTTADIEHHCMGLGTDGQNVWACSASGGFDDEWTIDVVVIAPATRQVIATVAADKVWDQITLPALNGRIWVLTGDGSRLVGIDTATFAPDPAIDLGVRCTGLAVSGAALVAACPLDNTVLRLDPAAPGSLTRATLTEPRGVSADAQGVWVILDSAVVRLDPVSLAPVATFSALPAMGLFGSVFVTSEAVWIRQRGGFLYQVDPATNQIVAQVVTPEALDGGSVLVTTDSVWATANENHRLFRLSRP